MSTATFSVPSCHQLERPENAVAFENCAVSWYGGVKDKYTGQDESILRYFHLPEKLEGVNYDLNLTRIPFGDPPDEESERSETCDMSWIKEFGNIDNSFSDAEFVFESRQLAELMQLAYSSHLRQEVVFHVEKTGGKFFFRRLHGDRVAPKYSKFESVRTIQGKMIKFYLISNSPTSAPIAPDPNQPIIEERNHIKAVFKAKVGKHKLLYSSAFKALLKPGDLKNMNEATFASLSTTFRSSIDEISWITALQKWSLDVLGNHTKHFIGCLPNWETGIVQDLQIVTLDKLFSVFQDQYKKSNPSYQGTPQKYACFGCLDELLSFLKRSMQDARPDDVYEFSFNSKNSRNVTLRKLDSDGLFVVPKEFKDWLKNQEPGPDLLLPEEELEQMVATFDVPHPEELEDSSVRFEKCAVSWYASRNSVSSEVGYCGQDGSAFDHLQVPSGRHHNVNFNLNRSHPDDDFKLDRFEEPESIGDSLSWIKEFGGQDNSFERAEFVFQNHQLAELLRLVYCSRNFHLKITLHITKLGGKIYFKRISCFKDQEEESNDFRYAPVDSYQKLRSKQGLIFQNYLLSESPNDAPDPNRPFIRGDKTTSVVFKAVVGKHKLLYSSVVLALDKPADLTNLEDASFTGIRTNIGISISQISWQKWLIWWSYCVLGKHEKTIVGSVPVPEEGIVRSLEIVPLDMMFPRLQRAFKFNSRNNRNGNTSTIPEENACFGCLEKILSFIKENLEAALPDEVYEFNFDSSEPRKATLKKVKSGAFVVPEWFKDWLNQKDAN